LLASVQANVEPWNTTMAIPNVEYLTVWEGLIDFCYERSNWDTCDCTVNISFHCGRDVKNT